MLSSLARNLRKAAQRVLTAYRSSQRRRASSVALRMLETRIGRTLSPSDRASSLAYATEVLGDPCHADGLMWYCLVAGEFREGWTPWRYFTEVVCPRVNGRLRYAAKVKTLSRRLFGSDAFPDVAYVINGAHYDVHWCR